MIEYWNVRITIENRNGDVKRDHYIYEEDSLQKAVRRVLLHDHYRRNKTLKFELERSERLA